MGIGDYVEVRRICGSLGRIHHPGTRGTVVGVSPVSVLVQLPNGGRFDAPLSNVARLVRAEAI